MKFALLAALAMLGPDGRASAQITITRTWEIPALIYGPDRWSIVRLSNSGESRQSAKVEVYRENGERLALGPDFQVEPRQHVDIRIEGKGKDDHLCSARVVEVADGSSAGIEVSAFVEVLSGNQIQDFPREAREPSGERAWVVPASEIKGKQYYFLNSGGHPTVVTFCTSNRPRRDACSEVRPIGRVTLKPRQSVVVALKKPRGKYFLAASSVPESAIIVLLTDGTGAVRKFSSESSITYGENAP